MKRTTLAALLGVALLFAASCKTQKDDKEAIRAGVMEHLSAMNTLNLNAMNIDVTQVTVNGNQAQAQVDFRPKTGAPAGVGMKISYNLEKRDGKWVVLQSLPVAGEMAHPAPGQAADPNQAVLPAGHPPVPSGNAAMPAGHPNFSEILKPAQPGAQSGAPPPAYPPANAQGQQPAPAQQPPKPR
jgi:hypothetical protein